MAITRLEIPLSPEIAGRPGATTFASLAELLRDGPLRTLLTLHVRAGLLAGSETDDAQRLEKLVELAQLSRMATAQLVDFTRELESLIEHLAAAGPKDR
jgi:hypothetical protein